jgi:hypothetical protein
VYRSFLNAYRTPHQLSNDYSFILSFKEFPEDLMDEFRQDITSITNERYQQQQQHQQQQDIGSKTSEQTARQNILDKGMLYSNMEPLTVGEELRKGSATVTVTGEYIIPLSILLKIIFAVHMVSYCSRLSC